MLAVSLCQGPRACPLQGCSHARRCSPAPQCVGLARSRPSIPADITCSSSHEARPSLPPDLSGKLWGWPPRVRLSTGLPLGALPFFTLQLMILPFTDGAHRMITASWLLQRSISQNSKKNPHRARIFQAEAVQDGVIGLCFQRFLIYGHT